jgi:hypothetical protein
VTADCVAALLDGEASPVDLTAFSPQRFAQQSANAAVEVA